MSWRGKYISWYRIVEETLGKLVPELTDQEVMENVTSEDQLIVPAGKKQLPRNKAKDTPQLRFKINDSGIDLGVLYHEQGQLKLLKNIFRETHKGDIEKLLDQLQSLDPSYETRLYSRARDEKPILLRKYVSARVDQQLIERLINESERLRRGGRQMQNNQSVYVKPKTSELYLTDITIPLNETAFRQGLETIKPIFTIVTEIKTQREIISERLSKPRIRRNLYREFIEALNEAKNKGLISAEYRREINKKWRDDEDGREVLMEMLKKLLNAES